MFVIDVGYWTEHFYALNNVAEVYIGRNFIAVHTLSTTDSFAKITSGKGPSIKENHLDIKKENELNQYCDNMEWL